MKTSTAALLASARSLRAHCLQVVIEVQLCPVLLGWAICILELTIRTEAIECCGCPVGGGERECVFPSSACPRTLEHLG